MLIIFNNFVKKYNKTYASPEELSRRKMIFIEHYKEMLVHNQKYREGKLSWSIRMTEDSDLTLEEWKMKACFQIKRIPNIKPFYISNLSYVWTFSKMNIRPLQYPSTLIQSRNINTDPEIEARIAQRAAPDSFSWLDSGVVTSVKNQVIFFTRPRL